MDKPALALQKPDTLRHQVEKHLREAIMSGRLAPGQRLVERELCEAMGISRPSLREALRRLEAERLIDMVPHRGPVVASVTEQEAVELYALRALLESHAARRFTVLATPVLIEELRQTVKNLHRKAKGGKREDLLQAKQLFYAVLLRGCGNSLIAEVLLTLLSRINRLRAASFSHPSRLTDSLREIDQLFERIVAGDPDGAAAIAADHVRKAEVAAMKVLKANEL
ncbi:MAG: GntR family transcriptional regulator [Burkholderiales bacterium]